MGYLQKKYDTQDNTPPRMIVKANVLDDGESATHKALRLYGNIVSAIFLRRQDYRCV